MAEDQPQKRRRGEWVPSHFLTDAAKQLDVSLKEMSVKLGLSRNALYQYRSRGECPVSVRIAVNGMLAEFAHGGEGQIKSGLPAVIVPKKPTTPGKKRRLTILVDEATIPHTRALLASLGCEILSNKTEE